MRVWNQQSTIMKAIWMFLAFVTAFICIHGTWTFRHNHQIAFAEGVEKHIDIPSIHVKAVEGILVLSGTGTRAQSVYAESTARGLLATYGPGAINAPKDVRNEIQIAENVGSVSKARIPARRAIFERVLAGFGNIANGILAVFL